MASRRYRATSQWPLLGQVHGQALGIAHPAAPARWGHQRVKEALPGGVVHRPGEGRRVAQLRSAQWSSRSSATRRCPSSSPARESRVVRTAGGRAGLKETTCRTRTPCRCAYDPLKNLVTTFFQLPTRLASSPTYSFFFSVHTVTFFSILRGSSHEQNTTKSHIDNSKGGNKLTSTAA